MSERLTHDNIVAHEAAKEYDQLSPKEREEIKREGGEEMELEKHEREYLDKTARRILPEIKKIFSVQPEYWENTDNEERVIPCWCKPFEEVQIAENSTKGEKELHNECLYGSRGAISNLCSWLYKFYDLGEYTENRVKELDGSHTLSVDARQLEGKDQLIDARNISEEIHLSPEQVKLLLREKILEKLINVKELDKIASKFEEEINKGENKYKVYGRRYVDTNIEGLYIELRPDAPFYDEDKRTKRELWQSLALYKFNVDENGVKK